MFGGRPQCRCFHSITPLLFQSFTKFAGSLTLSIAATVCKTLSSFLSSEQVPGRDFNRDWAWEQNSLPRHSLSSLVEC